MNKKFSLIMIALGPWSYHSYASTVSTEHAPQSVTGSHPAQHQKTPVAPADKSPQVLSPVEVTATRLERPLLTTPGAISVLNAQQIHEAGPGVQPDEALRQVPGVFLMNDQNYAQGPKISMRGFGARSAFGIRGITINVNGIPYTMPDGQSQIDALDLKDVDSVQVLRGPASVLYGNAAGGVINYTTADGSERNAGGHISMTGGSYGLRQFHVSHSGVNGKWNHSIGFTSLKQDGYRDHSEVKRYLFNGKVGYQFTNNQSLTLIGNVMESPRAEDPGGLTLAQVKAHRRQANFNSAPLDARSKTSQQIVGLHYEDTDLGGGQLNATTWFGRRKYYQVLPFPSKVTGSGNVPEFVRHEFGGRATYANDFHLVSLPVHYIVGTDVSRMEDNRHRYAKFYGWPHWKRIPRNGDQEQNGTDAGVFAEADIKLAPRWTLTSGVRYDNVHLTIHDRQNPANSGGRRFNQWSYSNGITWQYLQHHAAYATIGTAFQTPTFTEFARPDGNAGFNSTIKPQRATNYELGMRGDFPSTRTHYQVDVYTIRSKDELVGYNNAFEQTYYQNAGRTRRSGLELGVGTYLGAGFSADTDYSYMRARFSDNLAGTTIQRHNRLPGLPQRVWSTRLNWQHDNLRLTAENQYLSDMYADNANTVKIKSSSVYNLRGSYVFKLPHAQALTLSAGLDNIFNRHYYSNIRVNDANSRYYEPAPLRTFYASVAFGF